MAAVVVVIQNAGEPDYFLKYKITRRKFNELKDREYWKRKYEKKLRELKELERRKRNGNQ